LKAALFAQIRKLTDEGVTQFLSGMALGVDVWSAQAVLALRQGNPKLKLHCILPCMAQADAWSESERKQYHQILTQADSVVYVSREYHRNCMLERNHFMVDHAEVLLAVCTDVNAQRGGTAATIRYARKEGKEIILLNPINLDIIREGKG